MENDIQIQAAEEYVYAKRHQLPGTIRYRYKETYNYLQTLIEKAMSNGKLSRGPRTNEIHSRVSDEREELQTDLLRDHSF